MKNMGMKWKTLMLLVLALACGMATSSCGSDDDKTPANPLVGAWQVNVEEAVVQNLEQQVANFLASHEALSQEAVEVLTRVKQIVASVNFVVLINDDGTARLYSTRNGVGVFVSGSWQLTPQALLFTVGDLQLPVTDLKILDANNLSCTVAGVPLRFVRVQR